MEVPRWLEDLMDLLGLDLVERAEWIRRWREDVEWRPAPRDWLRLTKGGRYLDLDQLEAARRLQEATKEPDLGRVLIALGLVEEREVLQAKAQEAGIGFVDLDRVRIEPDAIACLSRELVTRHGVIPVKKDGSSLWLAMSDHQGMTILDAVKEATGCRVVPVLATPSGIQHAIDRYYPVGG